MRTPLLALLLALPLVSSAQRSGVYGSTAWSISNANALVWGGQPYVPVGAVVEGAPPAIDRAAAAGVKDFVVDVPSNGMGWSDAFAALEKHNARYLIRLNSLATLAKGVAVEPQSYRITGITTNRTVVVRLPMTTSALTILANARDGYVESVERVPVRNGTLTLDVRPKSDMERVLLIYPVTEGLEMPDFWEGLDQHRDLLLTSLRSSKPGNGLRGIVNPLGRTVSLPGKDFDFVPLSPAFQTEFALFLENRYRSVMTAMRSWSMNASEFTATDERGQPKANFNDLAKLVPLWNGPRGIPQLWDPTNDKLYPVDSKRSTIWKDVVEVVNAAGLRRFNRLVSAIQASANVPVIQEWTGWAAPYENPQSPLDGVGQRVVGNTPDAVIQTASRSMSSLFRWQKPGWLVATSITSTLVSTAIDNLAQMGSKGFFIEAKNDDEFKAIAAEGAKRTGDTLLSQSRPNVVFFPENAWNPAQAQKLPGGSWWLPTPADGNRILMGPNFRAYRMNLGGARTIALWTRTPGRYLLRMLKPAGVSFLAVDGSDPAPKIVKKGVEVNLGEAPVLISGTDEVPVPDAEVQNVITKFAKLLGEAQAAHRDATEERIAFEQAAQSFERNPGGSYLTMIDQYYRAAQQLGTFLWLEGERVGDTNFSEARSEPSASNGSVLSLRTTIPPDRAYFAEYSVPARTKEDQTVWLAARIPPEQRPFVQALIGGQTLAIEGEPVNGYGDGFGWYRLGSTKLAGVASKLRLTVIAPDGADLDIDAILMTPASFIPNGAMPPDPLER